nr:hypothetical protein [Providencia sneebia]
MPARVTGIVGYTNTLSESINTLALSTDANKDLGFPAMILNTSLSSGGCNYFGEGHFIERMHGSFQGYTLYDTVSGQRGGLMVTFEGVGKWKRQLANGELVQGTVTYDTGGGWTNNWDKPINGKTSSSRMRGGYVLNCPSVNPDEAPIIRNVFKYGGTKYSWISVRGVIISESGNIPPGIYVLPAAMLLSDGGDGVTSNKKEFLNALEVRVANFSCIIKLSKNNIYFDMANMQEDSVTISSSCLGARENIGNLKASLNVQASGTSSPSVSDPTKLVVANTNEQLVIRGSWNNDVLNCSRSSVFFDNRMGLDLGELKDGVQTDFPAQKLRFIACNEGQAPAGMYTAQATVSIVTR